MAKPATYEPLIIEALEESKTTGGLSTGDLVERFGCAPAYAHRIIQKLKAEGRLVKGDKTSTAAQRWFIDPDAEQEITARPRAATAAGASALPPLVLHGDSRAIVESPIPFEVVPQLGETFEVVGLQMLGNGGGTAVTMRGERGEVIQVIAPTPV